jgi:hypothetical protein
MELVAAWSITMKAKKKLEEDRLYVHKRIRKFQGQHIEDIPKPESG